MTGDISLLRIHRERSVSGVPDDTKSRHRVCSRKVAVTLSHFEEEGVERMKVGRMKVGKTYRFEAAHHLPEHMGKCRNLHGHGYKVEIEVEGGIIAEEGASDYWMVLDFSELDAAVQAIIDVFDHNDLNEVAQAAADRFSNSSIPPMRTTAEALATLFAIGVSDRIDKMPLRTRLFGDEPEVVRVRLWETAKSYAEWTA